MHRVADAEQLFANLSKMNARNPDCGSGHWSLRIASMLFAVSLVGDPHSFCSADETQLVRIDGSRSKAQLIDINSDFSFEMRVDRAKTAVAANEIVSWGAFSEETRFPWVVLADESVLVAETVSLGDEHLLIDSFVFGEVRLPISLVRGVIFRPHRAGRERDRLVDQIMVAASNVDSIVLSNGERIDGVIAPQPSSEAREVVTIKPTAASQLIGIAIERITAIVFNPVLVTRGQRAEERVLLGLKDGSFLQVAGVGRRGQQRSLALVDEFALTVDIDTLRSEACFLQPLASGVTYLSDLAPLSYKHVPWLEKSWPYKIDRNADGSRLRAGGHLYAKGIGMHSTSRLAYSLEGKYESFAASLAIDDSSGKRGSVIFRVFLYDGTRWKNGYDSRVIRGAEAPTAVSVSLRQALQMALIVEFAERGDELDRAMWLNARLNP